MDRFGATSTDTVVVSGRWVYGGTEYEDRLLRVRVDTDETAESREFFTSYKRVLMKRFDQEDIWITAQTIDVI